MFFIVWKTVSWANSALFDAAERRKRKKKRYDAAKQGREKRGKRRNGKNAETKREEIEDRNHPFPKNMKCHEIVSKTRSFRGWKNSCCLQKNYSGKRFLAPTQIRRHKSFLKEKVFSLATLSRNPKTAVCFSGKHQRKARGGGLSVYPVWISPIHL